MTPQDAQNGAIAATIAQDSTYPVIRLVLSTASAVTASAVPAGTYKCSLVVNGTGICYGLRTAAPVAAVPTNLADGDITKADCSIDTGELLTFDGTTKLAAILDGTGTTGILAIRRLF